MAGERKETLADFMRRYLTPKTSKAAQRIIAARLAKRDQGGKFKAKDATA